MITKDHKRAVVQVLHETHELTGWAFTPTGYLLTAGHAFIKASPRCKVQITSESAGKAVAILEEHSWGINGKPDFAILRIDDTDRDSLEFLKRLTFLTISEESADGSKALKGTLQGYGYPKILGGGTMTPRFEVMGSATIVDDSAGKREVVELKYQHQGNADGLSGAPLFAESDDGAQVVAIQIRQAKDVQSRDILYCEPLAAIYSHSKLFRSILDNLYYKQPTKQRPLFNNLELINLAITPTREQHESARSLIFIHDLSHRQRRHLTQGVDFNSNALQEQVSERVRSLPWIHRSVRTSPILFSTKAANWRDLDPRLSLVDLAQKFGHEELAQARAVFSPEAAIGVSEPICRDATHCVRILISEKPTGWTFCNSDGDPAFNVALGETPESVANLIEDILVDINVFYGLPFLPQLFGTIEARRMFSYLKAEFIRTNNFDSYGTALPAECNYGILASCARSSLLGISSEGRLQQIWHSFIHDFLFPPLLGRFRDKSVAGTDSEIVDRWLRMNIGHTDTEAVAIFASQVRERKDQLSRNELSRKLQAQPFQEGQLWFLATVVSVPERGSGHHKHLQALFRCQNLRRHSGAFPAQDLPKFVSVWRYIKIFVFRRRHPHGD